MAKTAPIDASAAVQREARKAGPRRMPVVRCPVCNNRAYTRTSEEVTPTLRFVYYFCSHYPCAMTWKAAISVEKVLSPSGLSPEFRPPHQKIDKPPGHEFGQAPLLDFIARQG